MRLDHLLSKEQLAGRGHLLKVMSWSVQSPVCPRVWGSGCSRVEHRLVDAASGLFAPVLVARLWTVWGVGVVSGTLLGPEGSGV